MIICSLGSSSRGFAILVVCGQLCLLLDCGIGAPTFTKRSGMVGMQPEVDYVLLSHGHGDHVNGAASVAKKFGATVLATRSTFRAKAMSRVRTLPKEQRMTMGVNDSFFLRDVKVDTFSIPHDKMNVGFSITHQGLKLTSVTDIGHINHRARLAAQDSDVSYH